MDDALNEALWRVEVAFVAHRPREVLDACSHCQGPVRVSDADPGALALGLGVTVGEPADVRALTPWLLRRMVTDERADLHTVLSRIAQFWGTWAESERDAVRGFVLALWSALLAEHPDEATAVVFLDGADGLGDGPEPLLAVWEGTDTPSADHHLAELVVDAFYGARVRPEVVTWARAAPRRERLRRALERDREQPWAGDLSAACELLRES